MEIQHEDSRVVKQLATIEPKWSPDFRRGRELLHARLSKRSYSQSWAVTAAAATVVCVAVFALPKTRSLAQELWYRYVLNRVDVVRLDLSKLPVHTHVISNGLEQPVQNVEGAETRAGFLPYLPSSSILDASPYIVVTGAIVMEQTIHVRELESSLNDAKANVRVPAEWEGVHLRYEIGPTVTADYPDNVQIVQSRPIRLSTPSNFALDYFAELAFRSIGVSSWEARAMAQKFAAHPTWLLDIPPEAAVSVREIMIRGSSALLVQDFDDKGAVRRATVIYNTEERMFSVSSGNAALSIRIAETLP